MPNGVRLSCAARVCLSQMQFYYDGRRQLQPLVRLPATQAFARIFPFTAAWEALAVNRLGTAIVMPAGPALRTNQHHRAPTPRDSPFVYDSGGNEPTSQMRRSRRTPPRWCALENSCCRFSRGQPNGVRLSCGAELEYSRMKFYHRRRAPAASGAC